MEIDYIIVGAGSAGCTLANRISESGQNSVAIIEFGGTDLSPLIQMPAALSYPMNMTKYDWGFSSEPEKNLNDRRLATPRGKVVGGSSSINGMVYVRGHPRDFDHWSQLGALGWSFSDVLPYFKRMENWDSGGHGGDKMWRGDSGPLHVGRGSRINPLNNMFVQAAKQAGYEVTDDYNGQKQEGFGPMDQTIYKGRRWSAANAYLRGALKKKNVIQITGLVNKVLFDGIKAVGVEIKKHDQTISVLKARKEIIISSSTINSPKILMLSGIGPAEHLKSKGIEVLLDRPGVGSNLQDHLEIYVQQACKTPITLYKYWNNLSKLLIGFKWVLAKKGLGASNHFETAGFIRSRAGIEYPNVQFHFLPIAVRYDGKIASDGHGWQAHVGPMRSDSRGEVRLRSKNFEDEPIIKFNYMSCETDWIEFRKCVRITRTIFAQAAFDDVRGDEIAPGKECQSNEDIDAFIRQNAESAYHPCGTCKMGAVSDVMAVVDPECRVIGTRGLRVVDSSIFPSIPNGNINAPTIMVAEKASDHILKKKPLKADNSKPWINPRWKASDR